jgi:WW domain-binding protein 11
MGAPPRKHHERNMPPKQQTTITARPQIRNLSADVTRFVPSSTLRRVKRDEPKKLKHKTYIQETHMSAQQNMPTKDDAYLQFMNELGDLL